MRLTPSPSLHSLSPLLLQLLCEGGPHPHHLLPMLPGSLLLGLLQRRQGGLGEGWEGGLKLIRIENNDSTLFTHFQTFYCTITDYDLGSVAGVAWEQLVGHVYWLVVIVFKELILIIPGTLSMIYTYICIPSAVPPLSLTPPTSLAPSSAPHALGTTLLSASPHAWW